MTERHRQDAYEMSNVIYAFGILLGSPLAVAKAAATLPGVHTKHDIIQNIIKQEQLKNRTTYFFKSHVAYISMHTNKLSRSNRGEVLCHGVALSFFLNQVRFLFEHYEMEVPCSKGSI
jgi:hypothetical protein